MDIIKYLLAEDDFVEGQSARPVDAISLGARMADLYQRWDSPAGLDLPAIASGFLERLGQRDSPIGETCLRMASELERWGGHAYHSAGHHAEVATNAMILTECAVSPTDIFSAGQRAILLAGCLAHDIHFEPGRHPRFAAELKSAEILDDAAASCGVRAPDRGTLRSIVLATEPKFRSRLAALLHGEIDPAVDLELCIPAHPPATAGLAAVISDADMLSSAGLTTDWHHKQLSRLAREFGREISPAEDLRFFDEIVGQVFLSSGGQIFSGNLANIRETVRQASTSCSEEKPVDTRRETKRPL